MKIIQIVTWKIELVGLIFVKNCGENFALSYVLFLIMRYVTYIARALINILKITIELRGRTGV